MALSTQPYKGARDFYPEDKRLQKYMFGIWRTVVERYGYEEYDAPILEPLDIYLAKSGEEIVNEQTYNFVDRGGRQVVIRPEMTPTVSRMVAARRQQLAYPLRWYSIPNLWRYERPQRGRLREHWQLNVDVFGLSTVAAEVELISVVDDIFKAFGARPDMYRIKLNHRGLINYLLDDVLSLDETEQHSVSKLIDRMHKLERSAFISAIDAAITDAHKASGVTERILAILDSQTIDQLPADAQNHPAVADLRYVLEELRKTGVTNVEYDVTLMRGFDYYTGIVFEVADTDPENNRSMMGGGRYDGLVGLFGVEPVPTVGFGWGDVTLESFLSSHRLLPDLISTTDLYVALIGDVESAAQPIIKQLRQSLNVAVGAAGRKLGDQFKAAEKLGLTQVLIIGETEITSGSLKLKNLATSEELSLTVNEIIATKQ
ncbi:MAG: histidine--tRNA ligase [Candidatus Saccharimonadales bacterium]